MSEKQTQQEMNSKGDGNWSDLSQRLVSGLVLAAVVIAITWSGPVPFAILVAVGSVILCWEWAKMVRRTDFDELLVLHIIAVLMSCGLTAYGKPVTALLVLLIGPAIKFGMTVQREARYLGVSLLGVPYVGLPMMALIWLRMDPVYGFATIIYLFVTVWSVDIFAYIFGRNFGGPKFAPRISPKKTWSGFIGGVSAGMIAGTLFGAYMGNHSVWKLALVTLLIGIFSQLGDLFESAFKRSYNVKDASNLIPGHGGLFDRVDGLVFAAILAALIGWFFDAHNPGQALLIWGGAAS